MNKKKKSTNISPYPDEVIDRLARAFYPAILACWNSEAYQLCAQRGFSERTLRNAKEALQLRVLMIGQVPNRRTYWYRDEMDPEAVRADILNQNQQLCAESVQSGKNVPH